jgi:hypothetical protein
MGGLKKFLTERYINKAISITKDLIEYWKAPPSITLKEIFSIADSNYSAYNHLRKNYNYEFPQVVYEKFQERFTLGEELSKLLKKEQLEIILGAALDRQIRELSSLISWKEAFYKHSKLSKDTNLQELLKILEGELKEMSIANEY